MNKAKTKVSRFELLMDAGYGAQKAGDILIRAFARMGNYVYIEPMIPAEISPPFRTRPALSGVIIRVGDFNLTNIGSDTDIVIATHEIVLDRRLDDEKFNSAAKVLLDMDDKPKNTESYEMVCKRATKYGLTIIPFQLDKESDAILQSLGGKGKNMFYLGMAGEMYLLPEELLIEEIKKTFGKRLKEDILEKNLTLFRNGYAYAKDNIPFGYQIDGKPSSTPKILIDGNSSLSMGLIDAGVKFFSGYPITPASSIMHTLAKQLPCYGGIVHQAEDEIAAIGAAIGSYYGGVPAATATSGPGLSLKQEYIGYAAAAEIPVIIIDAQRSGPSTGMPTKTEQSDLPAALWGTHGDATKIIFSVANILDCFYAPHVARYLAEKLKLPVFIMSDFQTANSYKVVDKLKPVEMADSRDIPDFVLDRFFINRIEADVETVRTQQDVPGTAGGMRRVTGLNTDEEGKVNYFWRSNQRSHEVRNQKIHHVRQALKIPEMFGPEEGELLIIGWGSTRGIIEESIGSLNAEGLSAAGMHLKFVYPLPLMLKDIFQKYKKVVTIELAYGDDFKPAPLASLLRMETAFPVQNGISKVKGRPISPKSIMKYVHGVFQ